MYIYICIYVNTYIYMFIYTYVCIHINTYIHVYIYMYMYVRIHLHSYSHAQIHTHTRTLTHAYTHIQTEFRALTSSPAAMASATASTMPAPAAYWSECRPPCSRTTTSHSFFSLSTALSSAVCPFCGCV